MNTMELVHFVSTGERAYDRSEPASSPAFYSELIRPARCAMLCARQYLLGEQRSDGSWLGAQQADASLASQLIFVLAYFGRDESTLTEQAAATILDQQLPHGGWPRVPGGPADLNTSVQAYFALKLGGMDASDIRLSAARDAVRRLGGADAADLPTRFFLALLGQIGYDRCPAIVPELSLLNRRHARILAPLAAIWSHRPVQHVGTERGVRELFVQHPSDWSTPPVAADLPSTVASVFTSVAYRLERIGWLPLRKYALHRVQLQLLRNLDNSRVDPLDFCELVWHAIAIHAIGYHDGSPQRQACEDQLRSTMQISDDSDLARPRIRRAPVTDTIAALQPLVASGMTAAHPSIAAAAEWLSNSRRVEAVPCTTELAGLIELLCAEGNREGDAEEALPPAIDLDRSTKGRRGHRHPLHARIGRVAHVMLTRLLGQQNADGGWANFGGQSTPDVTGAVLEALHVQSNETVAPAARSAVKYLRQAQRPDGSWDSAHGVRLIHGTSLAIRGLLAAGVPAGDEAVAGGVNWLLVHQQSSGGWGELPSQAAHDDADDYMPGPATASQTGWALLALVAAGRANAVPARRGIEFLLETQQSAGQWHEPQFVLRDPAAGRWFHSNLHTLASPLLALSRWAVAAASDESHAPTTAALRVVCAAAD